MATTTDAIEEKLEIASNNSSAIQDPTRTQVYRKTPTITNRPSPDRSERQHPNKPQTQTSNANEIRRSQTFQQYQESGKRGNLDISEVVDKSKLIVRDTKSISSS